MLVIQRHDNVTAILEMYARVANGREISARGTKSRNIHNLAIVLNADEPVITNFAHRKMNLAYAKREWLWYLGADAHDNSICQYATAWRKLQQADGSFYSNYGQYLFGPAGLNRGSNCQSQFEYVVNTLLDDPESRRASMTLLRSEHLYLGNTDLVCTYAINFFINNGYLDMTVMMRSNDVIWGFTNDAFCFWNLYLFVYAAICHQLPGLKKGTYTHMANSMHVYDRHYVMIKDIVDTPEFTPVHVPMPTTDEAIQLVRSRGEEGEGAYTTWLKTFD